MMQKFGFAQVPAVQPTTASNADPPRLEEAGAGPVDEPNLLSALATDPWVILLRGTLLALVRRDGRDLSARQLTTFLTVYMDETTYTVSSLAELLHVSRPGVTRIMDRLIEFDLIAREDDREDRRRVLVRRTARGAAFFQELVGMTRSLATEPEAAAA